MKTQTITFKVATYTLTGKSFLCPESTIKDGDLVIAFEPLKQVDPANKYAFVMDKDGDTQSVSRKFLKKETVIELSYERPQLSTFNQETQLKLNAMREYFTALKTSETQHNG